MEYEFDIYEASETFESLVYSPAHDSDEPECECRFCGDQADASDCDLHGARRPVGRTDSIVWVSTPCSCVDGDTRTCYLHGEAA